MNPDARLHFDRGVELARDREFEAAASEFDLSYKLDATKEALFAWAQAERLRGKCARAIELYKMFLDTGPTPAQTDAATLNVHRCEKILDEERSVAVETPADKPSALAAAPRPAAPTVQLLVAPLAPPPARSQVVGIALVVGSAVAAVTGGTFLVLSRLDERAAQNADTWGRYHASAQDARTKERIAIGAAGAGLVLGGVALIRWLVAPDARGGAVAWVQPDGTVFGWKGLY